MTTVKGKVFLVGAGPGDPELLTLRAHRLLRTADVVLHDDLVSPEILESIHGGALVINVGKRHGEKRITQQQIHSLMFSFAQQGQSVVRLKSGDPLIFGRAGEEIEALENEGIEFEVVPGITAALGAAASLGISLTDRRLASTVIVTTAHNCADKAPPDWRGLARKDATLAIYKPGDDYAGLANQLISAGLPGDTSCLIVSRAATLHELVRRTSLSELQAVPPLPAPALLLIGDVTANYQREKLSVIADTHIFQQEISVNTSGMSNDGHHGHEYDAYVYAL